MLLPLPLPAFLCSFLATVCACCSTPDPTHSTLGSIGSVLEYLSFTQKQDVPRVLLPKIISYGDDLHPCSWNG